MCFTYTDICTYVYVYLHMCFADVIHVYTQYKYIDCFEYAYFSATTDPSFPNIKTSAPDAPTSPGAKRPPRPPTKSKKQIPQFWALILLWCRLRNPKVDLPFESSRRSGQEPLHVLTPSCRVRDDLSHGRNSLHRAYLGPQNIMAQSREVHTKRRLFHMPLGSRQWPFFTGILL